MKRNRPPRQIPNTITVRWAQAAGENADWWVTWALPADRPTSNLCLQTIQKLGEELRARGYDISTLRFSVKRVPPDEFKSAP